MDNYKIYDIALNQYFNFEKLSYLCIWLLDRHILDKSNYSSYWGREFIRISKDDLKIIAHHVNDYFYLKDKKVGHCYYWFSNYSTNNRFIIFDSNNKIINKNQLFDYFNTVMVPSFIKSERINYRRTLNNRWINKQLHFDKKWNNINSLRHRSNKIYCGYRFPKTKQELTTSEVKYLDGYIFVRGKRQKRYLPNSWFDIKFSRKGFGWKRETKFKKQWMKNIWMKQ